MSLMPPLESASLVTLPPELVAHLASFLRSSDQLALSMTCRDLWMSCSSSLGGTLQLHPHETDWEAVQERARTTQRMLVMSGVDSMFLAITIRCAVHLQELRITRSGSLDGAQTLWAITAALPPSLHTASLSIMIPNSSGRMEDVLVNSHINFDTAGFKSLCSTWVNFRTLTLSFCIRPYIEEELGWLTPMLNSFVATLPALNTLSLRFSNQSLHPRRWGVSQPDITRFLRQARMPALRSFALATGLRASAWENTLAQLARYALTFIHAHAATLQAVSLAGPWQANRMHGDQEIWNPASPLPGALRASGALRVLCVSSSMFLTLLGRGHADGPLESLRELHLVESDTGARLKDAVLARVGRAPNVRVLQLTLYDMLPTTAYDALGRSYPLLQELYVDLTKAAETDVTSSMDYLDHRFTHPDFIKHFRYLRRISVCTGHAARERLQWEVTRDSRGRSNGLQQLGRPAAPVCTFEHDDESG